MNENYIRTDLAGECRARAGEKCNNLPGIEFAENTYGSITVSHLTVTTQDGEKLLGKPMGKYITIGFGKPWLLSEKEYSDIKAKISASLLEMLGGTAPQSVLVAGLGNRKMTSDCIGPDTVSEITVTRHIKQNDKKLFDRLGKSEISAIVPGVCGETGMESADIIKKAVELSSPDCVIVIDSLAARSPDRLMRTVQLCDSGISPGSGTGNTRKKLDKDYIGVPVIVIGVPCVVDSSTLIYDALNKGGCSEIPEQMKKILDNGKNFFVSLKECDVAVRELSLLLSEAIDDALSFSSR